MASHRDTICGKYSFGKQESTRSWDAWDTNNVVRVSTVFILNPAGGGGGRMVDARTPGHHQRSDRPVSALS